MGDEHPSNDSMADELADALKDDVVEGEIVPEPMLPAVRDDLPASIFGDDPVSALEMARAMVQRMEAMIAPRRQDFVCNIQGRDYPKVDWWTAAGQPLGLSPRVVWCRQVEGMEPQTFEARVEVYDRQGNLWSSGQALCSRGERTWAKRDAYALYSMAQTRSTGKAYRLPLSFLAVLAGLQPTPAEEMPRTPDTSTPSRQQKPQERPQKAAQANPQQPQGDRPPRPDIEPGATLKLTITKLQPQTAWKKKGNKEMYDKSFYAAEWPGVVFRTVSNPDKHGWGDGSVVTADTGAGGENADEPTLDCWYFDKQGKWYVRVDKVRPFTGEAAPKPEPKAAEPSLIQLRAKCLVCKRAMGDEEWRTVCKSHFGANERGVIRHPMICKDRELLASFPAVAYAFTAELALAPPDDAAKKPVYNPSLIPDDPDDLDDDVLDSLEDFGDDK